MTGKISDSSAGRSSASDTDVTGADGSPARTVPRVADGVPDFVDPTDVSEASLAASASWGEERPAAGWASSATAGSADASDEGGQADTRRARRGTWAAGGAETSTSTGRRKRSAKKRPQPSWKEKAKRREKRAQARAEAEAKEREKDPIGHAREIVLTQLTSAPRSRAQLEEKLISREVDPDVAEVVLDRMEDVGLVNDEELAGMIVRSQLATRRLGRRALSQELRRKGIDDEIASHTLEAEVTDDVERQNALILARKKMRTMSNLDEAAKTRRLAGLLARKGYSGSLTWSVIREVLGEDGDEVVLDDPDAP